jgi:uncharacterized membrane protein YhaH (DUF805 family)
MSFQDAIRSVLSQYVGFSGRARRSEYWYFALFNFIVSIITRVIDGAAGVYPVITGLVSLALLLPGIAVGIRRLHDTGRSGWWLLLALIPIIGAIILIVWFCGDSQPDNEYGPNPKSVAPAAPAAPQAPPAPAT